MLCFDGSQSLLIFGGPYSNLPATKAMRALADDLQVSADHIFCTGDIVAYAAEPQETAEFIRNWGIHVIAGNCEEQLAAEAENCGCGFEEGSTCDMLSRSWYGFAAKNTSREIRTWMASLPSSLRFEFAGLSCLALHGGTSQNNRFIFKSDTAALHEEAENAQADIVFAGHAGIPFITRIAKTTWVNAGVIGVPANDGTQNGWYALVDANDTGVRISLRRMAYDYQSAAEAIRQAGHAIPYAEAIVNGIWPSHAVLPEAELAQTGIKLRQKTIRLKRPAASIR